MRNEADPLKVKTSDNSLVNHEEVDLQFKTQKQNKPRKHDSSHKLLKDVTKEGKILIYIRLS